jgi:hypothetical protein
MSLGAAWRRVSGHFGSPDPRIAACNTVALIVVGNQPFYPFYVWYAAGAPVGAAYLTWLSTPFFVAAPWLARRHSLGGRVMLLCASLGNTVLAAGALGPASGVELFYLPCLVLSFIGFRATGHRAPVDARHQCRLPARRHGPDGVPDAAGALRQPKRRMTRSVIQKPIVAEAPVTTAPQAMSTTARVAV